MINLSNISSNMVAPLLSGWCLSIRLIIIRKVVWWYCPGEGGVNIKTCHLLLSSWTLAVISSEAISTLTLETIHFIHTHSTVETLWSWWKTTFIIAELTSCAMVVRNTVTPEYILFYQTQSIIQAWIILALLHLLFTCSSWKYINPLTWWLIRL